MNFAVVKFINETDTDEEVVSEVPCSWLTRNNEFCLWPPEKYASIYITKNFPPQKDWNEYPIELECFCETLAEAKQKTKGKTEDKTGRGFRKIKPAYYFSPAEEEERIKEKRKDTLLKKSIRSGSCTTDDNANAHVNFMKFLNDDPGDERDEDTSVLATASDRSNISKPCISAAVAIVENSSQPAAITLDDNIDNTLLEELTTDENQNIGICNILDQNFILQDTNNVPLSTSQNNADGSSNSNSCSGSFPASVVADSDILNINKKLDNMFNLLSQLKLDMTDIKERLEDISSPNKAVAVTENELPMKVPLETLTELENLEQYIKTDKAGRLTLAKYFKNIGGNDYKDFVIRICKSLFRNSLAEACSWTGRKNNFSIGNLEFINIMFGVVHNKTRCTKKDFEMAVAEWLRHAKQRRLREKEAII